LERLSNVNLMHIYSEEVKIRNGENPHSLLHARDFRRLSKLGIIGNIHHDYVRRWVLSDECVEVLERADHLNGNERGRLKTI
jgi:hypothetical protein